MKKVWTLLLVVLALAAACSPPATSTTDVVELSAIDEFAAAFNETAEDGPTLVLLLSPT